jgi:hypothetical protein
MLIADEDARDLIEWKRRTWKEIPGVGHGATAWLGPSHRLHPKLAKMHSASPPEDGAFFIAGLSYDIEGSYDGTLLVSTCGISQQVSANPSIPTKYCLQG